MSNTPRPRTVTVTEQDVRRLAAIIYRDTVQAFEFSRDFLASLPDAPTEAPEPSHDFKPTEFGGDTCERCDKDVRSHLLPDAPTPTEAKNHRPTSASTFSISSPS
jgi:hypothetical protein